MASNISWDIVYVGACDAARIPPHFELAPEAKM
jgi:hypothetical protein